MSLNKKSIAGMSFSGGKKENYFFCLMEYYPNEQRWFLKTLDQVKEARSQSEDEIFKTWIEKNNVDELVVNFPLTETMCKRCQLDCPGENACIHPEVKDVRDEIEKLLEEDQSLVATNPKKYEQERVEDNKVHFTRTVLDKETTDHILSKSFKRKLKKGFTPYWNRPVDFWIWKNYYDQLLKLFGISYDSYGNTSVMLLHKVEYLSRHFPQKLSLMESDVYIVLIELYRAGTIQLKTLKELQSIDLNTLARVKIIRAIEKRLNIFIYNHDLELMSKNQKAFDSFLLAIAGQNYLEKKSTINSVEKSFIFPHFA